MRYAHCLLLFGFTVGVTLIASSLHAQTTGSAFGGISTNSGLFGSRTIGQGVNGPGAAFGGTPGNRVEQVQAGAGEVQGSERFVRDSRDPGAFVGADSADSANFFGQTQGGFAGSGLEQFLGRAAQRDFQNEGSANLGRRAPLRPSLSLGFDVSGPSAAVVSTQMTQRLAKLPNLQELTPVTVAIEGRTAILRGRVATQHDRQMLAQIVLLEPGVSAVRNELQLPVPKSAPLPAPPMSPAKELAADNVTPIPPPIPEGVSLEGPTLTKPAGPIAPTAPSFDE